MNRQRRLLPLALIVSLAFVAAPASAQTINSLAPVEVVLDGQQEPVGVAVRLDGTRYVSDAAAGVVYRISPTGTLTIAVSGLQRPAGVALDLFGRLLIAEEQAGRILRLEPTGALTVLASGLVSPRWLAVRADGSLYVSAHRLQPPAGLDPSEGEEIVRVVPGQTPVLVATGLERLEGLAVVDGALFAATMGLQSGTGATGQVLRFPILGDGSLGTPTAFIDVGASQPVGLMQPGQFAVVTGLFLASREATGAADPARRAITKLRLDATLTAFADTLGDPRGLALGVDGSLYLADGTAGRLLRFRAPPPPQLDPLPEFTTQLSIPVTGTTEAGARVDAVVLVDGAIQTVVAGTADAAGAFALTVPLTRNATNTLAVLATGAGGDGLTSPPTVVNLTHDDQAPGVAILTPTAGAWVRGTVSLQAQASDPNGVASITFLLDARALTTVENPTQPLSETFTATTTLDTTTRAEGGHFLTAVARDSAGNTASAGHSFVIDNTAPDTQITGGPAGEIPEATSTFTFTGTDNLAATANLTFAWRLDAGPWSAFSPATSATLTGLSEGSHTFEVKARDLAGNEDPTPAARTFTVSLKPVISSVDPASGPVGTFLTITGANFEPGATGVTFNGTGATLRTVTATEITTTVPIGATTGPLVVTTSRGTASATFTVTLTGDFALTASPAAPATVRVIAGDQGFASLRASGSGSFTSLVSLSVSGGATGITTSFSPQLVAPGGSSAVGFSVASTVSTGSYHFTISGQAQVNGQSVTRTAEVVLEVLAPDTPAVTGRVLTADTIPQPIPGVTVTLGTAFTLTDAGGNFVLLSPPSGPNMLLVDGRTASTAEAQYPPVEIQIDVAASGPTRVPFIVYLPKLDTAHPITLPLDASGAVTRTVQATTPLIPDLVVTIPQSTRIIGPDGNPVSQITITPVPIDRSPMPFPPGVSFPSLFTIQPGGAVPSQPLPITFPNTGQWEPGSTADLYFFDLATGGWEVWGTGTVTADGRQVASDPGFGLPRFAWHGIFCRLVCLLGGVPGGGHHSSGGEPVDLVTGQFLVSKTDLVVPGRLPISIQRSYRSGSSTAGLFGIGWTLGVYDSLLLATGTGLRLQEPDRSTYLFTPAGPGRWENRTEPAFLGAVIAQLEGDFRFELRLKDGTVRRYERLLGFADAAALAAITDRNGNTVTLTRQAEAFRNNRILRITEPAGRFVTLAYDGAGRITTITDPLNRALRYTYDAEGRLGTVTDPAGGVTTYAYDASHGIVSITDPRGITFITNEYDPQGRVVRQSQADGGVWTFAYTAEGNVVPIVTQTVVTDPRGNATKHRFDSRGFTLSVTDALGQVTQHERDASGNISATTDPLGRVTRFTYDAQGNVTSITDPAGNTRTFTYEPTFNRVTSITDPLGNVTRFEYDLAGNLTATVDPLGARITVAYDPTGQPTSTTDPLGNATLFAYDAHGNLATVTDPLGNATQRAYDAASRLVAQSDPRGTVTAFGYDPLNRLTQITQGLTSAGVTRVLFQDGFDTENGGVGTTNYAGLAQWTIARGCVDLIGNGFFDFFPGNGLYVDLDGSCFQAARIESKTAFALEPGTYELAFSLAGSQRSQSPSDSVTVILGEVFTETITLPSTAALSPFTRTITISAPTTGQLAFDHAGGDNIGLVLDAVRLTQQGEQGEPTPDIAVTQFAYDPNGNLLTVTDARGGVTSHTYDPMDRLATRTDPVGAVESFAYDGLGNLLQHTDRKGQVATFTYDALNRRTQAGYGDGSTTAFAYDAAGRLIAASDSVGGTIENAYDVLDRPVAQSTALGTVAYRYDALGRRAEMTAPGQAPVTYGYDAASRLTAITQGAQVVTLAYDAAGRRTLLTLPNSVSTEYQYDAASRLIALIYRNATGILGDLTYGYDATGNRTQVGGSFARTLLPEPVASATYDAANRQLTFRGQTLSYDANGNLTSDGTTTYAWDARNRLTALTAPATASFQYDALGRRTRKTIDGMNTAYLYDGLDIVQEATEAATVRYLRSLSVDEPLVRAETEHYLVDALGSVIALAGPTGDVGTLYTYEPFGRTVGSGVPTQNTFGFTGREEDGTNLYYYRARYYHPGLQRFISEDPVEFHGGDLNLYAYVWNSPLDYIDPPGLGGALMLGGRGGVYVGGRQLPQFRLPPARNLPRDQLRNTPDRPFPEGPARNQPPTGKELLDSAKPPAFRGPEIPHHPPKTEHLPHQPDVPVLGGGAGVDTPAPPLGGRKPPSGGDPCAGVSGLCI